MYQSGAKDDLLWHGRGTPKTCMGLLPPLGSEKGNRRSQLVSGQETTYKKASQGLHLMAKIVQIVIRLPNIYCDEILP